jgi:hypothetical protein
MELIYFTTASGAERNSDAHQFHYLLTYCDVDFKFEFSQLSWVLNVSVYNLSRDYMTL